MSGQTEAEFLAAYDPTKYPPTGVTVDLVLLTIVDGLLSVLLVERGGHPYKGKLALPGGFVEPDEDLDDAALRELAEETGIDVFKGHIEQLGAYGKPGRDPRFRIVSVAYIAFIEHPGDPKAGSDANNAWFVPVDELEPDKLAFDHETIIDDAIERARAKLEYTTHATAFLPPTFMLPELRRIYEAVWGIELDSGNFRRKVLAHPNFVVDTGFIKATGRAPGKLYMAGETALLYPPFYRGDES
jgi:8-oxo-dGTP diphosphatase